MIRGIISLLIRFTVVMMSPMPAGLRRVATVPQPQTHRGTPHHVALPLPAALTSSNWLSPLSPSLYSHALWLTRNHHEAEDLTQESISKALRAFDSFQTNTNFKAWIFRILRNTFLTSRTGIATSRTIFFEDHPDSSRHRRLAVPTPEETLIQPQ